MKKAVNYLSTSSYETLNEISDNTKYIWVVFHGMGYLSRYFLSHFKGLPSEEHYVIAPQAPAKYYMNMQFTKVGASWLTKEETQTEIENVLSYLDAVWDAEGGGKDLQLCVLGYSQGLSIASRWVARRKIQCNKLIFFSGGMPAELEPPDFDFLPTETDIYMIYGDKDHYLTPERLVHEQQRFEEIFRDRGQRIVFNGGHEMKPDILSQLIERWK